MKQKLFITLFLTLTGLLPNAQAAAPPVKDWQKCIGGTQQDIPSAMTRLSDGNTIVLGNVDSQDGDFTVNRGSTDIWLTKIDASGNIIWKKSFGGSSIDVGTGLSELTNGNIIITGYTSSSDGDFNHNNGNFDAIIICTNSTGNTLWTKIYGGSQVDLCYTHAITSDGGILLGGGSYSNDGDVSGNHGDQDFWVIKTDSLGNVVWQQSSGGSNTDVCYSITEDNTGNIYAAGTTNSSNCNVTGNHGNYDLWVVKYNASGNILWNKTFGGSDYETAQSILIDSHQNILIGGYSRSSNGDLTSNYGYGDSWLIQIDATGTLVRQMTFGGSGGENLYSILETADGGYLLTSGSTSNDVDVNNHIASEDMWLLKTDASFNTEWSHNYGGTGNDRPVSVIQNADGGFLLAGYTFSNDVDIIGQHGSADIWLMNLVCRVPSSFFSTNTLNACLNDTLTFLNTSTFAAQGNWYLDNAFYSTANSIRLNFNTTGVYNVKLNVQTCYYSSDNNMNVTVIDCNLPQVSITTSESTTICANSQVTFNDASANSTSRQWTFPGGSPSTSTLPNPVVTYSQPGVYSVMLTATNSYGSQTSMRLNYVVVNALPSIPVISISGNELTSTSADQYQWFYNDAPIATEVAQSMMAFVDGYYKVQVMNNNHCASESNSVYYVMTGIDESVSTDEISVYPNPATDFLKVKLPYSNSTGTIQMVNSAGQVVFENKVEKNDNISIDLANYANGIYHMVFMSKEGKTIQRSIIKY